MSATIGSAARVAGRGAVDPVMTCLVVGLALTLPAYLVMSFVPPKTQRESWRVLRWLLLVLGLFVLCVIFGNPYLLQVGDMVLHLLIPNAP